MATVTRSDSRLVSGIGPVSDILAVPEPPLNFIMNFKRARYPGLPLDMIGKYEDFCGGWAVRLSWVG